MMHTTRFRLRTLVVAAVAGIATIVAICIFQTFSSAPPPISLDPKIDCPRSVSLGECLYGSDKREIFTVRNSGGGELLLHTFSLSCTCSSIARVTSDGDRPIGNISLGAGEEVNIAVTVNVRSRFNGSMKTRISFQTSDQDTPEVGIDFAASRVIGGLTPIPGSCNFGSLPIGDKPLRTVHLVDEAVAPRKVTAVVSSNADRIQVTFIPSLLGAPMPMGVNNPGHYLGAIAITVDTSQPGP